MVAVSIWVVLPAWWAFTVVDIPVQPKTALLVFNALKAVCSHDNKQGCMHASDYIWSVGIVVDTFQKNLSQEEKQPHLQLLESI